MTRMMDMPIRVVIYEQAHHRGGAATEICVNLTGRVQEACAEHGVEYATVHSGTLKKWACGSGKAEKSQMMARSVAILGRPPVDDNESDAVLMAAWADEEYGQ
jgi:Holliday junction resolvasome RuvABC endonuclease subunit